MEKDFRTHPLVKQHRRVYLKNQARPRLERLRNCRKNARRTTDKSSTWRIGSSTTSTLKNSSTVLGVVKIKAIRLTANSECRFGVPFLVSRSYSNREFSKRHMTILTNSGFPRKWRGKNEKIRAASPLPGGTPYPYRWTENSEHSQHLQSIFDFLESTSTPLVPF